MFLNKKGIIEEFSVRAILWIVFVVVVFFGLFFLGKKLFGY